MTSSQNETTMQVVDAQKLAPFERHARIFEIADALAPGAAFILENTHDPRPLRAQLEALYPERFSWSYLEQGPARWRIEIRKIEGAV